MRSSLNLLFFLFLLPLHFVSSITVSAASPPFGLAGHADECNALLQFSNSLNVNTRIKSTVLCNENHLNYSSRPKTISWKNSTDCCTWDGITCNGFARSVVGVNLSCSYLQGTLHSNSTLFSLRYIEFLDLGGNSLSGQIPTSICQKSSLVLLDLTDNKLSGTMPPCLGNLSNLRQLELGFNKIQGQLPRTLENCTALERFSVASNEITDTFPLWLRSLPLLTLQLEGNNFHGSVEPNPTSFPFPYLVWLLLGQNNLSGWLPPDYFLGLNLSLIDLMDNSFDGNMQIPPPTATFYGIGNNRFTGHIPSMICNATKLFEVDLSNNSLTGNIPQCLLNVLTNLEGLNLAMNEFQGTIPEIHAPNNCSLKGIDLSQNHLIGTLPKSFARCNNLEILDVGGNKIEDSFPNWLETLPTLYVLTLRSNKFHGPTSSPLTIHPFPNLHIFDISHNSFCGAFPTQYIINFREMATGDKGRGDLQFHSHYVSHVYATRVILKGVEWELPGIQRSFMLIDISCNNFQGEIPEDIGNLRSLKGLNFSHNKLMGAIPSSLGKLTDLESLDLSSNDLTGQIPRALTDLPYLEILNLSNNQLTGPVPQGRQFNTFKNDSFSRNPGLCGPPLTRACGVNPTPSSTLAFQEDEGLGSWIEWKAVPMGCACGLAVGISAGYMAFQTGRPLWLMRMMEDKIYSLQTRARRTHGRSRG